MFKYNAATQSQVQLYSTILCRQMHWYSVYINMQLHKHKFGEWENSVYLVSKGILNLSHLVG